MESLNLRTFWQMRLTSSPAASVAPNHDGRSFANQISESVKKRQWEDALKLFDGMKHHELRADIFTYTALIGAWGRGRDPGSAVQVFGDILQQALIPNVITYSALITACEKAQDPKRAFQVFDGMQ